jgi:hypothetical protein
MTARSQQRGQHNVEDSYETCHKDDFNISGREDMEVEMSTCVNDMEKGVSGELTS